MKLNLISVVTPKTLPYVRKILSTKESKTDFQLLK